MASAPLPLPLPLTGGSHRRNHQFTSRIVAHGGPRRDTTLDAATRAQKLEHASFERNFGSTDDLVMEWDALSDDVQRIAAEVLRNQISLAAQIQRWYCAQTIQNWYRRRAAQWILKTLKKARLLRNWLRFRVYLRARMRAAKLLKRIMRKHYVRLIFRRAVAMNRAARKVQSVFIRRRKNKKLFDCIQILISLKRSRDHIMLFGLRRAVKRIAIERFPFMYSPPPPIVRLLHNMMRLRRLRYLQSQHGKLAYFILSQHFTEGPFLPSNMVIDYVRRKVITAQHQLAGTNQRSLIRRSRLSVHRSPTRQSKIIIPSSDGGSMGAIFGPQHLPSVFQGPYRPKSIYEAWVMIKDLYAVALQHPELLEDNTPPNPALLLTPALDSRRIHHRKPKPAPVKQEMSQQPSTTNLKSSKRRATTRKAAAQPTGGRGRLTDSQVVKVSSRASLTAASSRASLASASTKDLFDDDEKSQRDEGSSSELDKAAHSIDSDHVEAQKGPHLRLHLRTAASIRRQESINEARESDSSDSSSSKSSVHSSGAPSRYSSAVSSRRPSMSMESQGSFRRSSFSGKSSMEPQMGHTSHEQHLNGLRAMVADRPAHAHTHTNTEPTSSHDAAVHEPRPVHYVGRSLGAAHSPDHASLARRASDISGMVSKHSHDKHSVAHAPMARRASDLSGMVSGPTHDMQRTSHVAHAAHAPLTRRVGDRASLSERQPSGRGYAETLINSPTGAAALHKSSGTDVPVEKPVGDHVENMRPCFEPRPPPPQQQSQQSQPASVKSRRMSASSIPSAAVGRAKNVNSSPVRIRSLTVRAGYNQQCTEIALLGENHVAAAGPDPLRVRDRPRTEASPAPATANVVVEAVAQSLLPQSMEPPDDTDERLYSSSFEDLDPPAQNHPIALPLTISLPVLPDVNDCKPFDSISSAEKNAGSRASTLEFSPDEYHTQSAEGTPFKLLTTSTAALGQNFYQTSDSLAFSRTFSAGRLGDLGAASCEGRRPGASTPDREDDEDDGLDDWDLPENVLRQYSIKS